MFGGVRRRLALWYALTFSAALLLLGPILYLSVSHDQAAASDDALRLFAHRQALLALVTNGSTLGINPHFRAPPPLDERDTFYFLLDPAGHVRANPGQVHHSGLPDLQAVHAAVRQKIGVASTVSTRDAGDLHLFTVPILRGGHVVALLQA